MSVPIGVFDRPPPEGSGYTYTDVTDDWSAPVALIGAYTTYKRRLDRWIEGRF